MTTPNVQVGQVWADNDPRSAGRHVKVVGWADFPPGQTTNPRKAEVSLCTSDGQVIRDGRGRETRTRITISRLRPTSSGYRLIKDVSGTAPYVVEAGQ